MCVICFVAGTNNFIGNCYFIQVFSAMNRTTYIKNVTRNGLMQRYVKLIVTLYKNDAIKFSIFN